MRPASGPSGDGAQAQLVLQSVLDAHGGLGGLPPNLGDLFRDPYANDGARVHSNSWGSTLGDSRYDSQSFEVDDFVWNNRDCVICFSAGNEGTDADANGVVDPSSLTPPGTAKNCITVGASENDRPNFPLTYGSGWPNDFPANPLASDKTADNPLGMVAFSSRGPTKDQRYKPDVVAPGTYVLSTRSRALVDGVDRLRHVERPVVLLRRRHEHGDAAGRRLRRGRARDAGQERHADAERGGDQGDPRQRRGQHAGAVQPERGRSITEQQLWLGPRESRRLDHPARRERTAGSAKAGR